MKMKMSNEIIFESAHRLDSASGCSKNLHGHTFKVIATVIGYTHEMQKGMILDYGDFQNAMNEIKEEFDHATIVDVRKDIDLEICELLNKNGLKTVQIDIEPTAENLALLIFESLTNKFVDLSIKLFSVKVYETQTKFAQVNIEDNEDNLI